MKGILKFNLDNHDDDMALKRCHKSLAMTLVIWEFSQNSRKELESQVNDLDQFEAIDLVYKRFDELLEKYGIIINDLIE